MGLRDKQSKFVRMVADLIIFAYDNGYSLTFGDAYRDPRAFSLGSPYGKPTSNHKIRLAIDFNLFKDGKFLPGTADHQPLGDFWESMGGSWGGRFGDGNHYSLEHRGRR